MNLCSSTVHSLYLHSNGTLAIQTPKKKQTNKLTGGSVKSIRGASPSSTQSHLVQVKVLAPVAFEQQSLSTWETR